MGSDTVDAPDHEAGSTNVDSNDTLLAHATSQKAIPPGHLQRLMSDKMAHTPAKGRPPPPPTKVKKTEVLIDDQGRMYSVNNTNLVYSVNKNYRRDGLSLVDRGANGGLTGRDARTLFKTTRHVNVEGIGNHQVIDIPIVTSAGYTESQRGPVIVIMNQHADMGRGHTILSSPQMEAFGCKVDDRSFKAGGTQSITTPDGFVMPLHVHNGLPYLKMRPPTDRELSNPDIPHVVLTSDTDWDPSILDSPIDDMEKWRNSVVDYDSDEGERPFDDVGILKINNATSINKNESIVEDFLDLHDRKNASVDLDGLYEVFPRQTSELDWIDICLADVLGIDPVAPTPAMPPEFEVYQNVRRKPALFVPEANLAFDIESGPLIHKESFKDLITPKDTPTDVEPSRSKRSVVFDLESIPIHGEKVGPTGRDTSLEAPTPPPRGHQKPQADGRNSRNYDTGPPPTSSVR